jgi:hypothetical protein
MGYVPDSLDPPADFPEKLPSNIPAKVRHVLELCLVKNPAERPTADELVWKIDSIKH